MKKIFLFFILFIGIQAFAYESEIIPLKQNQKSDDASIEYGYIKNLKKPIAPIENKEERNINTLQLNAIPTYINEKKVRYDHNGMPQFAPLTTNEIIFDY